MSAAGEDKALMLACSCLNSFSKNNDSGGTLSFNVYFMLQGVGVQGWKLDSARLRSEIARVFEGDGGVCVYECVRA